MKIDPEILDTLNYLLQYGVQIRITKVGDALWYTFHALHDSPNYQLLIIQDPDKTCVVCKDRNWLHIALNLAPILGCPLYDQDDIEVNYA